ncbi:MAG: hypothetical protein HY005_01995 [Candidatus Staskawiczbacteria bacterium]|nr:hypothetical protein [Candidatus Staskawiczbacteria bacterium]
MNRCLTEYCRNKVATSKDVYCEECKSQHLADEEVRKTEWAAIKAQLKDQQDAIEADQKAVRSLWDECIRRRM